MKKLNRPPPHQTKILKNHFIEQKGQVTKYAYF